MALRIYRAPDTGYTYQYEEGKQPDGFELVKPKTEPKKRTTPNKAAKVANK